MYTRESWQPHTSDAWVYFDGSHNPSSLLTDRKVEAVREMVVRYFNTTSVYSIFRIYTPLGLTRPHPYDQCSFTKELTP